ncbi:hypothetical protein AC52_1792 [Escherichia coli 5-366-08_S3_C3]|nr:hypothetical protein AB72_0372 [Escherichia coli 1-250-04_S1_C3]KDX32446.1 hypothetical protein AB41_1372 [Escherichia coli 1-250-04_S1_C2]KDX33610.1 hypothetical protein AB13_1180 [Escherichia coli 1-250-04_S1_C1]KEL75672.1 hypothetical protein AC52_1792 [Escherichia coli 5-366-08_S3_C3]KEL94148.1 hypothetical protein AB94_1848 [Escherichia coli 5-366-08_S3_C1]
MAWLYVSFLHIFHASFLGLCTPSSQWLSGNGKKFINVCRHY